MSENIANERKTNPVGDTGKIVAENLKRLRGGMTLKMLSQKLEDIGRHLPVLALSRIEACERKVDVDDLTALAVALGVSPLTLLLPNSGSKYVRRKITGASHEYGANVLWLWALCKEPLELEGELIDIDLEEGEGLQSDQLRQIAIYKNMTRPNIEDRSNSVLELAQDNEYFKTDQLSISQGMSHLTITNTDIDE